MTEGSSLPQTADLQAGTQPQLWRWVVCGCQLNGPDSCSFEFPICLQKRRTILTVISEDPWSPQSKASFGTLVIRKYNTVLASGVCQENLGRAAGSGSLPVGKMGGEGHVARGKPGGQLFPSAPHPAPSTLCFPIHPHPPPPPHPRQAFCPLSNSCILTWLSQNLLLPPASFALRCKQLITALKCFPFTYLYTLKGSKPFPKQSSDSRISESGHQVRCFKRAGGREGGTETFPGRVTAQLWGRGSQKQGEINHLCHI